MLQIKIVSQRDEVKSHAWRARKRNNNAYTRLSSLTRFQLQSDFLLKLLSGPLFQNLDAVMIFCRYGRVAK
jgi:hypothetical protein